MFKFLILAILVPAVILQYADDIDYEDWDIVPFDPCSNKRPPPASLLIKNCPQMPCVLVRGTDPLMLAMNFTSQNDATSLRPILTLTMLGITAPYEMSANLTTACNWLVGARCPISVGEELTWHLALPISPIAPLVSITFELDLQDQRGQTQGCFMFDTVVVAN